MLRAHSGYLEWIVSNGVGVEIQDLLYPSLPTTPLPLADIECFWRKTLSGDSLPVCLHGPLVTASLVDGAPSSECCLQIERAMNVACGIGARFFIVHPQLGPSPPPLQVERAARAWAPAIEAARTRALTLLLENTNEDGPDGLARFCALARSPSLGLCLDIGHVHLHSRIGCMDWLSAYGDDLHYVHLYNASGRGAQHRALGDGEIDIEGFLARLKATRPGVPICLEMDVPQILASVPWLTARGLFKLKPLPTDFF
jgi:sugar phosphate isomerase/epimerase